MAGMIWSPQLVRLFAGKFAEVPGKFEKFFSPEPGKGE